MPGSGTGTATHSERGFWRTLILLLLAPLLSETRLYHQTPYSLAVPSSAFYGTRLRGNGLCGNNGTHAYRSTLRADPGNI